jgi:hypothetical protein
MLFRLEVNVVKILSTCYPFAMNDVCMVDQSQKNKTKF